MTPAALCPISDTTIHLTFGDSTAGALRHTDVAGQTIVWCDTLYEGPLPITDQASWRAARARFHAEMGVAPVEHLLDRIAKWDEQLDQALAQGLDVHLVIWCEHDLFDQAILIYLLDRIAHRFGLGPLPPVELICIDRHPSRPRFRGLGELKPSHLPPLLEQRQAVTDAQYDLAKRSWAALSDSNPLQVQTLTDELLMGGQAPLPFLRQALIRHLQQFPDSQTGLPRTERQILQHLANEGPATLAELFKHNDQMEEAPFMGDTTFLQRARWLWNSSCPLAALPKDDSSTDLWQRQLSITEAGQDVLAGRKDALTINGLHRQIGGVLIRGQSCAWRWDRATDRLVANMT